MMRYTIERGGEQRIAHDVEPRQFFELEEHPGVAYLAIRRTPAMEYLDRQLPRVTAFNLDDGVVESIRGDKPCSLLELVGTIQFKAAGAVGESGPVDDGRTNDTFKQLGREIAAFEEKYGAQPSAMVIARFAVGELKAIAEDMFKQGGDFHDHPTSEVTRLFGIPAKVIDDDLWRYPDALWVLA